MPTYDYKCKDALCEGKHTAIMAITEIGNYAVPACPICSGGMKRVFSHNINIQNLRDSH